MRWLHRMLWVLGGIAFVIAGLTVYAFATLAAPQEPLSSFLGAFPSEHRALGQLLALHADRLEAIDPVAQWQPPTRLTPVRAWIAERTNSVEVRATERATYVVGPRAFDDSTALEFATLAHAARDVREAGYTYAQLGELALAAQERRIVANYSVPALGLRSGSPNWRAALTGRALQSAKPLTQGRRRLTTVPVAPNAPLDPLYPLAVCAIDSPEGLTVALETLEALPQWSPRQKREVAFCLGMLYWWSPRRDNAELFSHLEGKVGPEDLRLCALGGATGGLNLMLRADDAPEDGTVPDFVERWRLGVRAPWVDRAVTQLQGVAIEGDEFYMIARIPAQDGYLNDVADWGAVNEPGERFFVMSFLGQGGYIGYLAAVRPEEVIALAALMPAADQELNGSFVWAYVKVLQHYDDLRAACWLPAMRSAFAMNHLTEEHIGLSFGARGTEDWRLLRPEIEAHIAQLASLTEVTVLDDSWPLLNRGRGPVCPRPVRDRTEERVEDPEFLKEVDAQLRAAWPSATPAYRQAVVTRHLPRLVREGIDLAPWQVHQPDIAPLLSALDDSPERQTLLGTFAP